LSKRPPTGVLLLSAHCDRTAQLALRGQLTAVGKQKGKRKPKPKTFSIGPLQTTAAANQSVTFTVRPPAAALSALRGGARESGTFTLTATGPGGSTTTAAAARRIRLVKLSSKHKRH
jgi:hypothetical protein